MDAFDGSRKIPKIKSINGSISPIDTRLNADSTLIRYLRGGSPITLSGGYRTCSDAFSSPSIKSNSSRGGSSTFGRSLSPLSAIENLISPPVYGTPVKLVDEDVLVMDEIIVESSSGGRVSKSLSWDSSGSSFNSASSLGIRGYKIELCRSWEEIGQCRSGYKCQFAHGKEELRPSYSPIKNKSEAPSRKSYANALSSNLPKSRFLPSATAASPSAVSSRPQSPSPSQNQNESPSQNEKPSPAINSDKNAGETSKKSPTTNIISEDWQPSDDGIEITGG
ncbi:uncharacterized protein [Euphorbia lathyris]|uniref:uncharacterized protein isoform X2 n=1 Tax=Euphorbia lathyris TaxID=212925 RepID=UPI003313A33A